MSLEKSRPYDYRMSSAEKEWVRRWKEAGAEMAEIRRRELRAMTDEKARAAIDAVLSLALSAYISPRRRQHSGLVEQQALFGSLRAR
jgi:hypothetical protein